VQERRKSMNILEMYKKLSKEDKANLTVYGIYDSIYNVARNEEIEISDKLATDIQELAYDLYLEDEYMNLSSSQIAYFLTECYAKDNTFMDKVDDIDYDDILQAVEDDDLDFYKDEMER
jgi:hypothetical protein